MGSASDMQRKADSNAWRVLMDLTSTLYAEPDKESLYLTTTMVKNDQNINVVHVDINPKMINNKIRKQVDRYWEQLKSSIGHLVDDNNNNNYLGTGVNAEGEGESVRLQVGREVENETIISKKEEEKENDYDYEYKNSYNTTAIRTTTIATAYSSSPPPPSSSWDLIKKALTLSCVAHRGQKRKSGKPFVEHPVAVACLLGDMKTDRDTIIAGLLHDSVEDSDLTLIEVERLFGKTVKLIVEGETKVSKLTKLTIPSSSSSSSRDKNHK